MTDNLKLSEPMRRLLVRSLSTTIVEHGPTRAALMRRGLVHNMNADPGRRARLTPKGALVAHTLLAEQVRP